MDGQSNNLIFNRIAAAIMMTFAINASGLAAADSEKISLNIKSQKIGAALMELSARSGVHIMLAQSAGDSVRFSGIEGTYTLQAALDQMLEGSGLMYEFVADDSVLVREASQTGGPDRDVEKTDSEVIEEMVVTATKRETRLQDTALSITALGSDLIEKRGLTQMSDYLSTLPGVTMQDRGAVGNSIVIRGIAVQPEQEKEAVGVYFGETPVTGLGLDGAGHGDFKMVDIDRVEVLRGPQGTLYGSGSMGGTVRIIPAAPDLQQLEGKVAVQYSNTDRFGGNNSVVQGVLNMPIIEDVLAVRGVAYRHDNSGYIQNIAASYTGPGNVVDPVSAWGGSVADQDDRGANDTTGFRVAALWQPLEELSVTLSHSWQETNQTGWSNADLSLPGRSQQTRVMAGDAPVLPLNGHIMGDVEGAHGEIELTALTVEYDFGWGSINSTSSWIDTDGWHDRDQTRNLSFLGNFWDTGPRTNDIFVQEIRFSSQFDGPVQVLAGAYYENRDANNYVSEGFRGDPDRIGDVTALMGWPLPTDAPDGFTFDGWEEFSALSHVHDTLKQKALFGELAWSIADDLVATVGVRAYKYEQTSFEIQDGVEWFTINPFVAKDLYAENSGRTWKANLSWNISDDSLLYFQWAEGFRPGEPLIVYPQESYDPDNTGFYTTATGAKVPIQNQTVPDTLENFELGFKTAFADSRVTLNASVYRINWSGLPVSVHLFHFDFGLPFGRSKVNAGKSTSEGIELESRMYLSDVLRLDLSASYNETKLAESQTGLGEKGDDLPGSADFNFSAGLEYGFNLSGYDAFARVDVSYLSDFETYIGQDDTVPRSGGYSLINLKSGVNFGKVDLDLFVKNLANADDLTWLTSSFSPAGPEGYLLSPRTVGLNISYHF